MLIVNAVSVDGSVVTELCVDSEAPAETVAWMMCHALGVGGNQAECAARYVVQHLEGGREVPPAGTLASLRVRNGDHLQLRPGPSSALKEQVEALARRILPESEACTAFLRRLHAGLDHPWGELLDAATRELSPARLRPLLSEAEWDAFALRALRETGEECVAGVLRHIARLQIRGAMVASRAYLRSDQPLAVIMALMVASNLEDCEAVEEVAAVLRHASPEARCSAIDTLCRLDPARASWEARALLEDPDASVRAAAEEVLRLR
jgi:hypothetical protein